VELGALRDRWTPRVDVAKREHGTPEGARSRQGGRLRSDDEGGRAGHRLQRTLKRAPARGRMNPTVKRRGNGGEDRLRAHGGNTKAHRRRGNQ
jgi:hypothetical protein